MNQIYRHAVRGGLYQVLGIGRMSLKAPVKDGAKLSLQDEVGGTFVVEDANDEGTVIHNEAILQCDLKTRLVNGANVVVYRGEDAKLWVRPEAEFHDGRFEKMRDDGTFASNDPKDDPKYAKVGLVDLEQDDQE